MSAERDERHSSEGESDQAAYGSSSVESENDSEDENEETSEHSGEEAAKKKRKAALKEVTKKLREAGISTNGQLMASKVDVGTMDASVGSVRLATNIHGVRVKKSKTYYRYDVKVEVNSRAGRTCEVTKKSRSDYITSERKRMCFAMMNSSALKKVLGDNVWFYDGQKILFTTTDLNLNDGVATVTVNSKDVRLRAETTMTVTISEVRSHFMVSQEEVVQLSNNPKLTDRSYAQFVDIVTSQYAFNSPEEHATYGTGLSYLMKPWEHGFEVNDVPVLDEGKYVAVGAHKGTSYVEGPKGRGGATIGLVLDTAKTAFHDQLSVLEKVLKCVGDKFLLDPMEVHTMISVRRHITGLFAQDRDFGDRTFQITKVCSRNAIQTEFDLNGTMVSVRDHYRNKYGYELQHPNLPVLEFRKSAVDVLYFPMEISYILDFQRVTQQQQTPLQLKKMKNACIVPPFKRTEQNKMSMEALGLHNGASKWLREAGLEVMEERLVVDGRILKTPTVVYGNSLKIKVDPVKMWSPPTPTQFVLPVSVGRWAMILLNGVKSKHKLDIAKALTKFADELLTMARSKGMVMGNADHVQEIDNPTPDLINQLVEKLKQENFEFIFFIQADTLKLHEAIKTAERTFEIVTQDMKLSKALDVVTKLQRQTMDNVVAKLNVKLGGLNYNVTPTSIKGDVISFDRLFIGLSISCPELQQTAADSEPGSRLPSVVGYAFNRSKPIEFVGDFGFQDARRTDTVSVIGTFVERMARQFTEARNLTPSKVIIYRAGVSEGEYAMILNYEVSLIREALKKADCGGSEVTLIVVNRMHKVRITPLTIRPTDSVGDQNVKPGTVVDSQMVHPVFSEFYLNSHRAFQGTAKVPRYTVIVDDSKFSLDELETMTYTLCFAHQIATLSTSTPTPLCVATRYAERGRYLAAFRRLCEEKKEEESGYVGSPSKAFSAVDLADLAYDGTALACKRINA